jgi:hypothetical protein
VKPGTIVVQIVQAFSSPKPAGLPDRDVIEQVGVDVGSGPTVDA